MRIERYRGAESSEGLAVEIQQVLDPRRTTEEKYLGLFGDYFITMRGEGQDNET